MTCSSDFISWDDEDLNLDLLLGEYTDEEKSANNHVSSESLSEQTVTYICPECNKNLKSISGFRGHVTKKHGLNIKASDHRRQPNVCTSSSEIKEPVQSTKHHKLSSEWIQKEVYEHIFPDTYQNALKSIQNSTLHNLFGRSAISEIAAFCEGSNEFQKSVKIFFSKLAAEPVNITLSDDRENLFRKFHELRLSSDVNEMKTILKNSNCPFDDDINNFIQVFLMELTNSILQALANTMKKKAKDENRALSDNEQQVLFYISGFIIHAVKKKYNKIKNKNDREFKLKVMDELTSDKCDKKYLEKYAILLEKKNRGGLQYPSENVFLLVRSIDSAVRANTDTNHSQNSLNKCVLKEKILENFMVKYHSEKLFPVNESSEDDEDMAKPPSIFLEDMINMFLKVRGFAAARVERNKIAIKSKSTDSSKAGSSFRDALKEKCLNVP